MGVGSGLLLFVIVVLCYRLYKRRNEKKINVAVAEFIKQNEIDLAKLDRQESVLKKAELSAYGRMVRKEQLPPELLEVWETIVREEMDKYAKEHDIDTDDTNDLET